MSGRLEDVPSSGLVRHFCILYLLHWGIGSEDSICKRKAAFGRLWASSGHRDKATSARTRRWQFGGNVQKWKIQKRGLLSLGHFFFAASGGEVGGCEVASRRRGTGLNTLAFVLELKQQTLPMQTLKKCIKRCNKTEPKGRVLWGKGSGRCKGVVQMSAVGTARRSCCNVDLMNISLGQLT